MKLTKMESQLEILIAVLSTIFIISSISGVHGMNQKVVPSCKESDEVCEFHFTVDYIWTMIRFNKTSLKGEPVVIRNGTFYLRRKDHSVGCNNFVKMTDEELKEVSFGDGRYTLLYAINQEYPAPSIVVHQGQTVVVHVTNALIREGLTIHWHGLEQRGTNYMDGVPMVTQNPINPGETFTYRFKANNPGTHWYHSHHGVTRTDGLYGPFVVLPRESREDTPEVAGDFLMLVQDFYHNLPSLYTTALQKYSLLFYQKGFDSNDCLYAGRGVEGVSITTQVFDSAVINGKGYKFNETTGKPQTPEVPLEDFLVEANLFYRFRIINTGMVDPFRISIDEHPLTVVATDGNDIKPIEVESVIVHNGERFDVMIHTNNLKGRYWIRAETLAIKEQDGETLRHPEYTLAILSYKGSETVSVGTQRDKCTQQKPCRILNCHYGQESPDANHLNQICFDLSDMQATEADMRKHPLPMPSPGDDIQELFLNFHFSSFYPNPPSVNGKSFVKPSTTLLFKKFGLPSSDTQDFSCLREECEVECHCQNIIKVKKGQILQVVLDNSDDQLNGMTHPIHLHGYMLHVLKVDYPSYNPDNGLIEDLNQDIAFAKNYTEQQWKNSSWIGNNVPGLNLRNPPRKDVITIPRKGYVVVRFRADNPGFWYMHCHKETHVQLGMALVLQVGELSEMPDIPDGFPVSVPLQQHINSVSDSDGDRDFKTLVGEGNNDGVQTKDEDTSNNQTLYICINVFLVLLVLSELGVIINMKLRDRGKTWTCVVRKTDSYHNERRSLLANYAKIRYNTKDESIS